MLKPLILLLTLITTTSLAQPLAGTDDLGRTLPLNDAVGNPKPNRQVGIFYFLWHDTAPARHWDLHEIVSKHPEVLEDFDHPEWGGDPKSGSVGMYYWGQPIYGYYKADDYWVHLRSMQLLTDAGVDFVVIDATNRLTYGKQADVLMQAMDAVRAQGKNPPKIVFYTNTQSGETMQEAYDIFYKNNAPYRHPECWYQLDGKPLIIGISKEAGGKDFQQFFTFRESQWPTEGQKKNGWPWISFTRPQKVHYNLQGEPEIINVSVAQHPNPTAGMGGSAFYGNKDNWGRSYRQGTMGNPETDMLKGYNIQEQWDYAIQQNTPFIYITGWNEWIAGKFETHDKNPEHSWFCDQASPEYSRDIEPTLTAGLKDHYYMQMVANIRRYKGIESNPSPGQAKTIRQLDDWKDVALTYRDYTGDTRERNHPGAQTEPAMMYVNKTGRNDFDILKVARDGKHLYFYAQTAAGISPNTDNKWMRLYLDTDRKPSTGWKGYDYRVVSGSTLQEYRGNQWRDAGKVTHQVQGNRMMISIPRSSLKNLNTPLNLEFKWSDNMQADDEPLDWYVNGDAAPGGRFNFLMIE
ncbi:hypothetical protein [Dyadobacter sandarakinus]|uniref:Glycosyl hydrolase family 71 n=1 Tax=Dyadobacter sandarakinus TaxID=2747268 RepID=A0ABX7I7T6_9BACT|nr:hypothetical protein [Dyadobacter sandarakinus]QRR02156.1 hypothetical protein HWI92_15200 [Dyadobacter sandarakinus]